MTPAPLVLSAEARNVVATPAPVVEDSVAMSRDLMDNLRHLPTGVAFLLGAPFVWEWRSASDVATLPEMVAWYATVVLGVWGVWLAFRARRWELAYPFLVAGGVGLVLSLIEGNTGTLLRHRAMLIPWLVMFAAIATAHLRKSSPH